ncbi:MAG: hypothetical protein DI635_00810 [Pseudoxanthomonas suwonensis]|nr:MAG: hypothetical protein DI635_00810 [Pseudoxanthomonas suwonensis]
MKDYSLQGKIYLAERLPGAKHGKLVWVGDAPKCDLSLSTDSETRTESYSGKRMQSAILRKGVTAELSLTLNYLNAETLALGLHAKSLTVAGGTVTGESLPAALVAGDVVGLDHGGISNLVLTDSASGTLVLDTHYTIDSVAGGVVRILDPGTLQQPFSAAYSYSGGASAALFTSDPPERYLFLDGVNTIDGSRVLLHLYRTQFNPASSVPMINDSFGQMELTGSALFDPDAALDGDLGGFGRFVFPNEVAP